TSLSLAVVWSPSASFLLVLFVSREQRQSGRGGPLTAGSRTPNVRNKAVPEETPPCVGGFRAVIGYDFWEST
ncbi:hypothetical protein Taro_020526, partial [Colocasia esculenta]|nr:hypothetical protein [Colocasia esculenta]